MTQMFKVQSVCCKRLFCTLRSAPQLTFVPSTWQSSLCSQVDLAWKTQGGESDMSQTWSAMAMISYPDIIVPIFLPLLNYLQQLLFQQSFAPSFGKSFLPGWLPKKLPITTTPVQHNLGSLWENHDLKSQDSDTNPKQVVEPPSKIFRLVPNVKLMKHL